MVSALYAVLGALLLIKFSFDVVRLRMQYRVSYGDGGFSELQSAIRIHGNAVDQITDSYRRYLEHTFREAFKLQGTPLRIQFVTAKNPFADKDKK